MNCYDLLMEVKEKKNIKSDNELAQFLKITRQSINGIKKGGGFNDEIAIKVAEITKRDLAEILLIREIQGEQNEKIRSAWERISKMTGIAASGLLVMFLMHSHIDYSDIKSVSLADNIHYAQYQHPVLGNRLPAIRYLNLPVFLT